MDQAYLAIGENGPFQKITILVVSLGSLLATIYPLSYSYLTKLPSFLCHENSSPNSKIYECKYAKDLCNSNIEMVKNLKTSVINWAYDFDLYCSREYYNDIISSSFFIGVIIGSTTLAILPDKYGRQKIFQLLLCLSCFLHFNMSESPICLNAKGRKDECIQTLEKIVAILNGKLPSWEDYQKCNPNLLKEDNDIRKEKKGKIILYCK